MLVPFVGRRTLGVFGLVSVCIAGHVEVAMAGPGTSGQRDRGELLDERLGTAPTCDFTGDGICDLSDIDLLIAAIAGGSSDFQFDINSDGFVDLLDYGPWFSAAGAEHLDTGVPYSQVDFNLDGRVDAQDYMIWNGNKFTTTQKFSAGDANADGVIDGMDFIAWNAEKFTTQGNSAVGHPVIEFPVDGFFQPFPGLNYLMGSTGNPGDGIPDFFFDRATGQLRCEPDGTAVNSFIIGGPPAMSLQLPDGGLVLGTIPPGNIFTQGHAGDAEQWCATFPITGLMHTSLSFPLATYANPGDPSYLTVYGSLDDGTVFFTGVTGTCDTVGLGECTLSSLDLIVATIIIGTNNPIADLTGDGLVNLDDLDQWLADAGALHLDTGVPFDRADFNLDGSVDIKDYANWNAFKYIFGAGGSAGVGVGDANADGTVDASDFNIWNTSRFTEQGVSEVSTTLVPLPFGVAPGSPGDGVPDFYINANTGVLTVELDGAAMQGCSIEGPVANQILLPDGGSPAPGVTFVQGYANGAEQWAVSMPLYDVGMSYTSAGVTEFDLARYPVPRSPAGFAVFVILDDGQAFSTEAVVRQPVGPEPLWDNGLDDRAVAYLSTSNAHGDTRVADDCWLKEGMFYQIDSVKVRMALTDGVEPDTKLDSYKDCDGRPEHNIVLNTYLQTGAVIVDPAPTGDLEGMVVWEITYAIDAFVQGEDLAWLSPVHYGDGRAFWLSAGNGVIQGSQAQYRETLAGQWHDVSTTLCCGVCTDMYLIVDGECCWRVLDQDTYALAGLDNPAYAQNAPWARTLDDFQLSDSCGDSADWELCRIEAYFATNCDISTIYGEVYRNDCDAPSGITTPLHRLMPISVEPTGDVVSSLPVYKVTFRPDNATLASGQNYWFSVFSEQGFAAGKRSVWLFNGPANCDIRINEAMYSNPVIGIDPPQGISELSFGPAAQRDMAFSVWVRRP